MISGQKRPFDDGYAAMPSFQVDAVNQALAQHQALVAQLQGQLMLQRTTAAAQLKEQMKTHISRSQADSELAFSVDLLTFANSRNRNGRPGSQLWTGPS